MTKAIISTIVFSAMLPAALVGQDAMMKRQEPTMKSVPMKSVPMMKKSTAPAMKKKSKKKARKHPKRRIKARRRA